jgi:hypothetical protein
MKQEEYFEIVGRFTYHPPIGSQPDRYVEIRERAMAFALLICQECPDSREKSLAITKIEEAVMWANSAISRREREVES